MYIDLHCDTIIKYIKNKNPEEIMYGKNSDINLNKLIENKVKAQFMAIYLFDDNYDDNPKLGKISDWDYIERCVDFFDEIEKEYKDSISVVTNYNEYNTAKEKGKTSIFKTIEDGRCIKKIDDIDKLKKLGITLVTLLWNNNNKLGFPHSKIKEENEKGLTNFGIDIVGKMNDEKMIIDVSHLSEGGFWDIYNYSKLPFMATHSNAKKIENHSRNLNDKQIKAIAEKGGIIGLNVFPPFTNGSNTAVMEDYLKHISHIKKIGGDDVIALGTDFDGINGNYEINSPKKIIDFMNYLTKAGFSSDFIEKFAYKNVERFLQEIYR